MEAKNPPIEKDKSSSKPPFLGSMVILQGVLICCVEFWRSFVWLKTAGGDQSCQTLGINQLSPA